LDAAGVRARFDDLGAGGFGVELTEPVQEFVAYSPDDVAATLRAAEHAARHRWVAGFVSYEAAAAFDGLAVRAWPAGHPLRELPLVWFAAFDRHTAVRPVVASGERVDWALTQDQAWHRSAVERTQAAIAAGEFYQLNLTTRLSGAVREPETLYPGLAAAQAGHYNAMLVTPAHAIVSASPELFFTRTGDELVTRPMKGTAPRGASEPEDAANASALRASAKERAENIMIVDLLRNDLGRIATTGSVTVRSLLDVEPYPTLWQLTSTITASVAPDVGLADVFGALFPCGSVTGAPKASAMHAIASLEAGPRGVYCGAVGFLRPHPVRPAARFAVAIRTVTADRASGYAEYGSGGAITASSDPAAEWAELLVKTAVLRGVRQEQPH
jgi:para-aminobenzoate synthetase/4-amino-4-deoxychorismate lyase